MLSFRYSTKQLSDAEVDTAIISVGSTEQCGPCLPLHIDTLVAEYFAHAFGERLNAYVLPTMPFNTAEEHAGFRGTVTLRPSTVMLVLEEVVAGLRAQGFQKQVLTCGHGGSHWLTAFIKQINWQFADIVVVNAHQGGARVWEAARQHAGLAGRGEVHGGAESRALALYLAPECVLPGTFGKKIREEEQAYMDYMSWEKLAPDGSWGAYAESDADIATAEAGKALLDYFVTHQGAWLAKHLMGACKLKGIPM